MPGKNGGAGIALLVGRIPKGSVTVEAQVELARLHLGLLEAEEIGVKRIESFGETFPCTGPQAVDIP